MVQAVADQVVERVRQQFQDGLVEFDGGPLGHQFDLLAQLPGEITDEPREAAKQRTHWLQPGLQHRFLELRGDPTEALDEGAVGR